MSSAYLRDYTPIRDSIRTLLFGLVLAYAAFLLAWVALWWKEQGLIVDFLTYALIVAAFGSISLLLGNELARGLLHLVLRPYTRYLDSLLDMLAVYRSQVEWPGRKFLDLLRPTRLIEARREFLLLGLEASLPELTESTTALLDRLSSVLLVLEMEATEAERGDLIEIARRVRGYLYRLHNLIRIKRVILSIVRAGAPALVAFVLVKYVLSGPPLVTALNIIPELKSKIIEFFLIQDNSFFCTLPAAKGRLMTILGNLISQQTLAPFCDVPNDRDELGSTSNFALAYFASGRALTEFMYGLIILGGVPFWVYSIGQILYVATWGLAKRTTAALDDVLWMVFSWTAAGVIGITILMFALHQMNKPPPPLRASIAVMQYLMSPPEKSDKIKLIRELEPETLAPKEKADPNVKSREIKISRARDEITVDVDDPRVKSFPRGEDRKPDAAEESAGTCRYSIELQKLRKNPDAARPAPGTSDAVSAPAAANDTSTQAREPAVNAPLPTKASAPQPKNLFDLKQKDWKNFAKSYIDCKVGESGTTILRILCISWAIGMLVLLLRALCGRVLRQMAARTEQRYDDMAVELTNIFGTAILVAIGLGWILTVTLGGGDSGDSGGGGGGNSLLPFAILVAVAGTVMGIASRDLLLNFFAGVSLRIDKPFDVHERIVLENGAVCEVRAIGMRSTHFFNIIENTDIYIPNSELAQKTVVNLSRPDREYRRILTYWISDSHELNLRLADRLLLLSAYSVEGIDTPTIRDEFSEGAAFYRNRPGIAAEFAKLQDRYDECVNAIIKFHGRPEPIGDVVEQLCGQLTNHIAEITRTRNTRWDNTTGIANGEFIENLKEYVADLKRLGPDRVDDETLEINKRPVARTLARTYGISYNFYELAMCFYTLSASYPVVRADLEQLVLEILRAPSVRSTHVVSEDGSSGWKVELIVYAQLTEQSDEILHHLNLFNQRLLSAAELLPRQPPKYMPPDEEPRKPPDVPPGDRPRAIPAPREPADAPGGSK
jgi:hypothetical protein